MIEKALIGKEDINFGTGTVTRRSQAGSTINITQVNAGQIPIIDAATRFSALGLFPADVEEALALCQLLNESGSHSANYTNKSGSTRNIGDVVILDPSSAYGFTTTTTIGNTQFLGVAVEAISVNALGRLATGGFCSTIRVTGTTSIGSYLRTSTTAGAAVSSATLSQGTFGIALTSTSGAGNVAALIFGTVGQNFLPIAGGNLTGTLGLFKGTDVTSASALNPWASSNVGNYFDVTGTSAITSIATSSNVGTVLILHFDDALTLTHHATNLILPGAANITTSAGDELSFIEYASGQWRCVGYVDASTTGTGNIVRATSPTLTTPIIGDFSTATHTHANAAGGGNTLTIPTIADFTNATHNHSSNATGGATLGASSLRFKEVDIGDWNMSVTTNVNVAHGLTHANIRGVQVLIREDAGTLIYPIDYSTDGLVVAGSVSFPDTTNVNVRRITGGFFDNASYDATSFNRGYIILWYT